jgi:hypothetical protein
MFTDNYGWATIKTKLTKKLKSKQFLVLNEPKEHEFSLKNAYSQRFLSLFVAFLDFSSFLTLLAGL